MGAPPPRDLHLHPAPPPLACLPPLAPLPRRHWLEVPFEVQGWAPQGVLGHMLNPRGLCPHPRRGVALPPHCPGSLQGWKMVPVKPKLEEPAATAPTWRTPRLSPSTWMWTKG